MMKIQSMAGSIFFHVVIFPALLLAGGELDSSPSSMPVKEVTVFKDGHAYILREGNMPVDGAGNVLLQDLPAPVLGTFWPYSAGTDARLTAVVAGARNVTKERPALSLREILEANAGAQVTITESGGEQYGATILQVPSMEAGSAERPAPRSTDGRSGKGDMILLKTQTGVKVVSLNRIQDVTFQGSYRTTYGVKEFKNLLSLKLDWGGKRPEKTASVGMVYVQKGLRWIPSYKVTLDGKGNAAIRLQATLINELVDLENTTAHLVIGVPTIFFKDTLDPISLEKTLAQLSQYFREDARTPNALSNVIRTQTARMSEYRSPAARRESSGADRELSRSDKDEDLFVFTVKGITLKRNERMTLPVVEYTLKYRDIYTLDLPVAPPPELNRNLNSEQQRELARLLQAPKVMHKIRLENNSKYPLTTAPALILKEGRVLAQGLMTYTAVNGATDLAVTAAIDIRVQKTDSETKRTPNAVTLQGNQYTRVDLAGTVGLTNHLGRELEVVVTRHVFGIADSADHDGAIRQTGVFEDGGWMSWENLPAWLSWHSWQNWPSGFRHLNGIARIQWRLEIPAGKKVELGYTWHYHWR